MRPKESIARSSNNPQGSRSKWVSEFETNLDCTASSRSAKGYIVRPCFNILLLPKERLKVVWCANGIGNGQECPRLQWCLYAKTTRWQKLTDDFEMRPKETQGLISSASESLLKVTERPQIQRWELTVSTDFL